MREDIKVLYETTELTLDEIAKQTNTSYKIVWSYIAKTYSKEFRNLRKSKCYRNSKLGDKNPMLGKFGSLNPTFKDRPKSDCKGYLLMLKPDWFTGRTKSKHVFYHHIVLCEALGITEIPYGFVVHHIDHNPLNNDLNNLALLSNAAHMKLHAKERATTRTKVRTSEANADGSAPQV